MASVLRHGGYVGNFHYTYAAKTQLEPPTPTDAYQTGLPCTLMLTNDDINEHVH